MSESKVYTYKGKSYVVFGIIEVKNPVTRAWENYIHYSSTETGNFKEYAREEKEFYELFKPLTHD